MPKSTSRSLFSLLALGVAAVSLFPTADAAPASLSPKAGWTLVQSSPMMGGHTLKVRKDAIRVESTNSGVVLICRAPKFDVLVFNTHNGRSYQTTYANFKGEVASRLFNGHRDNIITGKWIKGENTRACGADVVRWSMHRPPHRHHADNSRFDFGHNATVVASTYWVTREPELPLELAELLSKVDAVCHTRGIPVKFIYNDVNGGEHIQLLTSSFKAESLPDSVFELPANSKRVAKEELVYEDPKSQEVMEGCVDFLNDVDPDIKKARKKSTQKP